MAEQVRAGQERAAWSLSGTVMVVGQLLALALAVALVVGGATASSTVLVVAGVLLFLVDAIAVGGYVTVQPLQSRVVTLFGRYIGTIRQEGLRWVNPFTVRRSFSLRVRNLESDTLKVNDAVGNPVEIAAVVDWRVVDTAKAAVRRRGLRGVRRGPGRGRGAPHGQPVPLRRRTRSGRPRCARTRRVAEQLTVELQRAGRGGRGRGPRVPRVTPPRVRPRDRRRCCAASRPRAIVAARAKIVEGAVGMVEQRAGAAVASRTSSSWTRSARPRWSPTCWWCSAATAAAQPVVNTGTLYG